MVRTQIQLTEDQYRQLKRWARERGVSLAEAVRRCVADRLAGDTRETDRESRVREALTIVGKYTDETTPSRVARDHDRYLAESYRG